MSALSVESERRLPSFLHETWCNGSLAPPRVRKDRVKGHFLDPVDLDKSTTESTGKA